MGEPCLWLQIATEPSQLTTNDVCKFAVWISFDLWPHLNASKRIVQLVTLFGFTCYTTLVGCVMPLAIPQLLNDSHFERLFGADILAQWIHFVDVTATLMCTCNSTKLLVFSLYTVQCIQCCLSAINTRLIYLRHKCRRTKQAYTKLSIYVGTIEWLQSAPDAAHWKVRDIDLPFIYYGRTRLEVSITGAVHSYWLTCIDSGLDLAWHEM